MSHQTIYLPETIFSVGGVPLDDCNLTCVKTGEQLDINIEQPFIYPGLAITAVDIVLNTFTLEYGQWASLFPIGSTFDIADSTGNNGTYTVTNVTQVHVGPNDITTIYVSTPIPDATADGVALSSSCTGVDRTVDVTILDGDTLNVIQTWHYDDSADLFLITATIAYVFASYQNLKVIYTAADCFNSVTRTYDLRACINYSIKKTCCHEYLFTDSDTTSVGKISVITVTNINGTYRKVYTLDIGSSTINIILPEDGIYNISVTNNLSTVVISFPLYDLCDLVYCLRHMILEVLCNDDNPCDECGSSIAPVEFPLHHHREHKLPNNYRKMTSEQRRGELNKVIALGSQLLAQVKYQELTSIGINYPNSQIHLKMVRINSIFERINAIIARCGHCKGTTTKRWN